MERQIYPLIDPRIERYCDSITSKETPNLTELDRQTHLRFVKPRMISGNWQGTLLKILSLIVQPKRVLEVGTFTAYATICLAEGLPPNGIIHTIEKDEEKEAFLNEMLSKNDMTGRVKLHIGNALDIIPTLSESFDMIFIDADKASYPNYYRLCKEKLNKGGLLLADNILWYGKVAMDDVPNDKQTQAIKQFNSLIAADEDFDQTILPIRDGLLVGRRK
jgi:predicted O-methyltransferase YrrM